MEIPFSNWILGQRLKSSLYLIKCKWNQNGAFCILSDGANFYKVHHCCCRLYGLCCHNLTGSVMPPFPLLRNAPLHKLWHLKISGTAQVVKMIATDGLEKWNASTTLSKLWQVWAWNISQCHREKVCEVSETRVRWELQHHVRKKTVFRDGLYLTGPVHATSLLSVPLHRENHPALCLVVTKII